MTSTRAVLAAGALLLATVGGVASAAPGRAIPTARVQASNFKFCPASAAMCTPTDSGTVTTVKVGSRVIWTYTDHACDVVLPCPGHNVVFSNGTGTRKLIKKQGAVIYSAIFKRPGRFSYVCTAHAQFGMTGTLVVKR